MQLTQEQKRKLIKPGTIWARKKNGKLERVYLESVHSKLLRDGSKELDILTEFGFEHVPLLRFLAYYEFLGWARIKLPNICDNKNLIPLIEVVSRKD